MIIKTVAYPRAALIGNPSDGYNGKTIAFVFRNYSAEVRLYETPELELLPAKRDNNVFADLDALTSDVELYGYYGGIRLLKAAVKKFNEYCHRHGLKLEKKNFTMRYSSTIPNRLGLAGSSAIITAAMRAMCEFYHIRLAPAILANIVLSTERDELGIPAGLQDRVAQAYNIPVYMDFDASYMNEHGIGRYEAIEIPDGLNLYVAYRTDLAEGSEVLHSRLREEYEARVPHVVAAMREWAELTEQVRACLGSREFDRIPALLDRNFDLRCEVCANAVSEKNRRMVELARSVGASAKFTGSGGAIIGTYEDEKMFRRLADVLRNERIDVIKPEIVTSGEIR
ncbi:mevalonate kinase family protein [Victivallis vadensis]|jgi:GHMP kinase|uniref:Glucuronokinase n=2 Tax=Victivallis vadensis TaxID=172901 RepID=A0A2U1AT37_9BACT|nr:GHMP kinase [Victivallis vadensis]PVY39568.1 glucuronokinase [Victivallis vadensis]PWM84252.1 MAG: GHMP kinase [Lentisphaerota bacterium]